MKIKSILLMAGAAVAGIYLTSEEGKKARQALQKKKSAIEPVIKDLIKQANEVLDGSKKINSDEIRLNVNKLVDEAKAILVNLDLDKAVETSKEAIKVASKKINEASNDVTKAKRKVATKKATAKAPAKKAASKKKTVAKKK